MVVAAAAVVAVALALAVARFGRNAGVAHEVVAVVHEVQQEVRPLRLPELTNIHAEGTNPVHRK